VNMSFLSLTYYRRQCTWVKYGAVFPLLSLFLFIDEVVVNGAICWLFVLLAGSRMRIHLQRWADTDSLWCRLQWMRSATFCYSLWVLGFSLLKWSDIFLFIHFLSAVISVSCLSTL